MNITWSEFKSSPLQDEGFKAVVAPCRVCDKDVIVLAQWSNGSVEVMSTGGKPGCSNPKCHDKIPCVAKRMATQDEICMRKVQHSACVGLRNDMWEFEVLNSLLMADSPQEFAAAISAAVDLKQITEGDE